MGIFRLVLKLRMWCLWVAVAWLIIIIGTFSYCRPWNSLDFAFLHYAFIFLPWQFKKVSSSQPLNAHHFSAQSVGAIRRKSKFLTGKVCCSWADVQSSWVPWIKQNVSIAKPGKFQLRYTVYSTRNLRVLIIRIPVLILINHSAPISNTPIRNPPNAMPSTPGRPKSKQGGPETYTWKKTLDASLI